MAQDERGQSFPQELREFFAYLRDELRWRAYMPSAGTTARKGWITISVPQDQAQRLGGWFPPNNIHPLPRSAPPHTLLNYQDDRGVDDGLTPAERTQRLGHLLEAEALEWGFAVDWNGDGNQAILVCFPEHLPQLVRSPH